MTTGLLQTMNRVELEGVLAHELSHIKNYDILVQTVAVVAVGAIALMCDIGLRFMVWGGLRRGRRDNVDAGPIGIVVALAAMVLLLLAPFAAMLMQFSMSRKRELLADAPGVSLTRYPPGAGARRCASSGRHVGGARGHRARPPSCGSSRRSTASRATRGRS